MEKLFPPSSSTESAGLNVLESLEELLRFTLESSIAQILGFDLGLSDSFCAGLLKSDPADPSTEFASDSCGVPSYPLYKHLASAVYDTSSTGSFFRKGIKMKMIQENISTKQKESEWLELLMDKGSKVVKILQTVDIELYVEESFLMQLKDGQKTIEARVASSFYRRIRPRTLVLFNKCLVTEVQYVRWYASFSDMLDAESLEKVLPGVKAISEGVQICRRLNKEDGERSDGVIAMSLSIVALQPYITLASLLHELSYEGVQGLLGLMHTTGTIPELLPPPRLALLSSAMLPYKPEVKGSALSHSARALAKHSHRSRNRFWGTLGGSDLDKNKLATSVISHLIANCCWMNVHVVPPHGVVFEVRIADGYGARWSFNGCKAAMEGRENKYSMSDWCLEINFLSLVFLLVAEEH